MATLLSTIARRCIDEYESMGLNNFYSVEQMPTWGYCSDRMKGVLLEEALTRQSRTMGQCVGDAEQDADLERAFQFMPLPKCYQMVAIERLRHDFSVVLAHEIKKQLMIKYGVAIY